MQRLETPTVPLETPERDLTRLPRRPGPGGRVMKCTGKRGEGVCGKPLGIVDGATLYIRMSDREYMTTLPAQVRCERCGTWQTVS